MSSFEQLQAPSCASGDNRPSRRSMAQSAEERSGSGPANTPGVKPLFVTRRQAAAMFSCSDQTISKMHKSGRLPFYYLGRHAVRIRLADLEAMLSNPPKNRGGRDVYA